MKRFPVLFAVILLNSCEQPKNKKLVETPNNAASIKSSEPGRYVAKQDTLIGSSFVVIDKQVIYIKPYNTDADELVEGSLLIRDMNKQKTVVILDSIDINQCHIAVASNSELLIGNENDIYIFNTQSYKNNLFYKCSSTNEFIYSLNYNYENKLLTFLTVDIPDKKIILHVFDFFLKRQIGQVNFEYNPVESEETLLSSMQSLGDMLVVNINNKLYLVDLRHFSLKLLTDKLTVTHSFLFATDENTLLFGEGAENCTLNFFTLKDKIVQPAQFNLSNKYFALNENIELISSLVNNKPKVMLTYADKVFVFDKKKWNGTKDLILFKNDSMSLKTYKERGLSGVIVNYNNLQK